MKDAPIIVILMILVGLLDIHSPLALGKWCNIKYSGPKINRVLIPMVASNLESKCVCKLASL